MPRVHVEYGPPGHRGVSTIMGVGDAEYADTSEKLVGYGALVAGVTWGWAGAVGNRSLATAAAGATIALTLVEIVRRLR